MLTFRGENATLNRLIFEQKIAENSAFKNRSAVQQIRVTFRVLRETELTKMSFKTMG